LELSPEPTRCSGEDQREQGTGRGVDVWVARLQKRHRRREETVAKLHQVLLRSAYHELWRRRGQLDSMRGPEFDDLAQQAADDALMKILGRLDEFRGESRFTTWAYRFVIFEVADKAARHAWRKHPPIAEALQLEQLPDTLAACSGDRVETREQLAALSAAIAELPERQREVFVAVALNQIPADVLAIELRSNRNAIYKNLFDARRTLRARLALAGYPIAGDTTG
jgi:RNA polymerase sigma-70 factor (ECF subfamily)